MGVPKGTRIGGRQKGTPNKDTQDLLEKCRKCGIDVFEAMLDIAMNGPTLELRGAMLKECAQYLYPKRRAVEMSGDVNLELAKKAEEYSALTKEQTIELMKAEIKKLEGGVE